jgi:predicted ArsR family transcriptional regulator
MEGSDQRTTPGVPGEPLAGTQGDTMPEPTRTARAAAEGRSLRRRILLRLRRDGPASPDRLAADLGASRNGVLQQLRALEAGGLVSHAPVRHGVGRPRHLYDVTPEAQDLFPANYDGLAVSLIGAISTVGGQELVARIVAARRSALAERARDHLDERAGPTAKLADRVRELAVFQDGLGYLAETVAGPDGELRLRQHNCAIHRVAATEPAVCQAELELFRELLGVEVERETHIASGDRSCTYLVGSEPAERPARRPDEAD